MTELQQLQQKRAELLAEQEELATSIPKLEAEFQALPDEQNHLGTMVPTAEKHAAWQSWSDAENRIGALPREIERLSAKIAHIERLLGVDEEIAVHEAAARAEDDQARRLEGRASELREKLEGMKDDIRNAFEAARKAEESAAAGFADAVGRGDSKAEKSAQAAMNVALDMGRQAAGQESTDQPLMRILETQAAEIEQKAGEARQRAAEARKKAGAAKLFKFEAMWNDAADQMASIGAQLIAANVASFDSLWRRLKDFKIPKMGYDACSVNWADLQRMANEKAV